MKKTKLLNAALSHLVAQLGHNDTIVVGDAGLPVPPGVPCIDLAVMRGLPRIDLVLEALESEMQVERMVLATETLAATDGQMPAWLPGCLAACRLARSAGGRRIARRLQAAQRPGACRHSYRRMHAFCECDAGGGRGFLGPRNSCKNIAACACVDWFSISFVVEMQY